MDQPYSFIIQSSNKPNFRAMNSQPFSNKGKVGVIKNTLLPTGLSKTKAVQPTFKISDYYPNNYSFTFEGIPPNQIDHSPYQSDSQILRMIYQLGYSPQGELKNLAMLRQSVFCKTQIIQNLEEKDSPKDQQGRMPKVKNQKQILLQKNMLQAFKSAILALVKKTRLLQMRSEKVNKFIRKQNKLVNIEVFNQLFQVEEFKVELARLMLNKKLLRCLQLSRISKEGLVNQIVLIKRALAEGRFQSDINLQPGQRSKVSSQIEI